MSLSGPRRCTGSQGDHTGVAQMTKEVPSMSAVDAAAVTVETTVALTGNNTGIEVPAAVIEQLGAGRRPAVLVEVNGYQYRSTVGVMGGRHLISISAAVRQATGLKGGDPIRVSLRVADTAREVAVPADFDAALAADERARTFFA